MANSGYAILTTKKQKSANCESCVNCENCANCESCANSANPRSHQKVQPVPESTSVHFADPNLHSKKQAVLYQYWHNTQLPKE